MRITITSKALVLLLCLLMVISTLATVPMGAESFDTVETAADADLLWSADFDGYTSSGKSLSEYIGSVFSTTLSSFGANNKIENGKLVVTKNAWQLNGSATNTFRDLYYGIYKDSDGNAVTEYYMDIDYILKDSLYARYYSLGEATVGDDKVTYTIYSPYRGDSFFNPMHGGDPYNKWLFKVSPNGTLYTADMFTPTIVFSTADGANTNLDYFTYTKKVNGTETESQQPMTDEVWNTIRNIYGKGKASSTASGSSDCFDKVVNLGCGYQLARDTEYTIRVAFSVSDTGRVTAKTYVRPAGTSDPFTYVGSTSYTFDTAKLTATNTIRISENSTTYSFDNMKIARYTPCAGEHSFPVVQQSVKTNGYEQYKLMECLSCGAEYYLYEGKETLQHADFTKLTSAEFADFKTNNIASMPDDCSFSEGSGIVFANNGGKIWITSPVAESGSVRLTFTANFSRFPSDWSDSTTVKDGASFLTLMTSTTAGYNIYARIGRNADGGADNNAEAEDSTGWIKLYDNTNKDDWNKAVALDGVKLELNTDYTFAFDFNIKANTFVLYINGSKAGEGTMTAFPLNTSAADYPAFRIGDGLGMNMILKEYKVEKLLGDTEYDLFEHTYGYNFNYDNSTYDPDFYADPEYGVLVGSDAVAEESDVTASSAYVGAPIWVRDTDLALINTPYTVSFDFMIGKNGKLVSTNSTSNDYMSLVSWITEGTSTGWGSMVRLGAQDTDGNGSLDKYFLVMSKEYTSADDSSAVYYVTPGEWIRVSVAVNPIDKSVYLYVNDELVGMAIRSAYQYGAGITKSSIRLCDSYRKLVFPWAVKDLEIDVTPNAPLTTTASGEIFRMDFGKAFTVNSGMTSNGIPSVGAASTGFGAAYEGVTGITSYRDTENAEGYAHIVVNPAQVQNGATNLFNVSTTSQLADGSLYNHLEGGKYSIEVSYAINKDKTSYNADEKAAVAKYNSENNTTYSENFNPVTATVAVIRLSKYTDGNACRLLNNDKQGLLLVTTSGNKEAYVKDENAESGYSRPNGYSSFDANGRPIDGFLTVTVVVDETTNTYTAYCGGELLYYVDANGDYVPAVKLPMNVTVNNKSLVYGDASWDGLYSSIPHATADGTTHSDSTFKNTSYIRFLQNVYDFSVQDIKIEKVDQIPEYVGSQVKLSDEGAAFDLRFVFGVDDIYVNDVEYDIKAYSINGDTGDLKTVSSLSTVYSSVVAGGETVNAYKYSEGKYFSVFKVEDIPLTSSADDMYVLEITPYVTAYNPSSGKVERGLLTVGDTYIVKYDGCGNYMGGMIVEKGENTVSFNYQNISALPYKALGRTQMLNGALAADWSAAGIEFNATCMGDVYLDITSSSLFTVTVDAENDGYDSVRKDVKLGSGRVIIASNLPYGKYTFRIENQSGYSGIVDIKGAAVFGTFDEAPADSDLYIEFIGDSITHGCGLGSPDYTNGTNDGTLTYAYLAAKELGADYTIMANGGMGVLWGSNDSNVSMSKYPYLNDTNRVGVAYEGYERDADIVVIGLSTNDNYRYTLKYKTELEAYNADNPDSSQEEIDAHMTLWTEDMMAQLKAELATLVEEIIKNHGDKVSIVLARGMMERAASESGAEFYHTSVTYMTKVIEEDWGNKYTVDGVEHTVLVAKLTPDRTGYEEHPTREGAATQGAELAKFIKDNMETLVPAE